MGNTIVILLCIGFVWAAPPAPPAPLSLEEDLVEARGWGHGHGDHDHGDIHEKLEELLETICDSLNVHVEEGIKGALEACREKGHISKRGEEKFFGNLGDLLGGIGDWAVKVACRTLDRLVEDNDLGGDEGGNGGGEGGDGGDEGGNGGDEGGNGGDEGGIGGDEGGIGGDEGGIGGGGEGDLGDY